MSRKRRMYFFEAPDTSQGKRFSRFNHPTKEVFQELFDSILFALESKDTAKEKEAGHIKLATDIDVIERTSIFADGHSRAVQPHQMVSLSLPDDVGALEITQIGTAYSKGGITITPVEILDGAKKRMSYMVQLEVGSSIQSDKNILALVNDIDIIDVSDNWKFYGIKENTRGFHSIFPEFQEGALYCRKVVNPGEPEYFELYWGDNPPSAPPATSRLYGAFSDVYYSGPGKEYIRFFGIPTANMKVGNTFKVRASFDVEANENVSEVGIELRTVNGNVIPIVLALRKDGNLTGGIEVNAEVTILGDTSPEAAMCTAKSFNSSVPSEVIVHHFHTRWDVSGDDSPFAFVLFANNNGGGTSIKNAQCVIELNN